MTYRLNELNQTEHLIRLGSLKKAINRVKELEKQPNLSEVDQIECQLLKIDALIQLGDVNEALRQINLLLNTDISLRFTSHALILKCEALFRIGKHEDSLTTASQLEDVIEKLTKTAQIEREYLIYIKGGYFLAKSANYLYKGKLDRALDFAQQSKKLFEKIGINFRIVQLDNIIGIVHQTKGDLSQAMKYYKQCLAISKENEYRYYILVALGNISEIYVQKGELIQALNNNQHQLAQLNQFEEFHSDTFLPSVFERIGYIYSQLGDLDQALKYLQKSHDMYKESQYQVSLTPLASSTRNLGNVYYKRGDLDQALKYYQESLLLLEEVGNVHYIATTLLDLIIITIDHHSLELTNQYLSQLRGINTQVKEVLINQKFRFAEALILKTKPRMMYNVKAQEILKQLTTEEIAENELAIIIMVNLCELLLDELRTYNEVEIFQEVKDLIQKLQLVAKNQHSLPLIIDVSILQSKFALIEGDLTRAAEILDHAEKMAREKTLGLLEGKVIKEKQLLEEQHETWEDLITSNASFHERLKQTKLKDYIKDAQQLISSRK